MQKWISNIDFFLFLLSEHPAGDDEQTSEAGAEDAAGKTVIDAAVDARKVADSCRMHEYKYKSCVYSNWVAFPPLVMYNIKIKYECN